MTSERRGHAKNAIRLAQSLAASYRCPECGASKTVAVTGSRSATMRVNHTPSCPRNDEDGNGA
jgi:transcription elongation factor Elf1